jgi:hypothetical protein
MSAVASRMTGQERGASQDDHRDDQDQAAGQARRGCPVAHFRRAPHPFGTYFLHQAERAWRSFPPPGPARPLVAQDPEHPRGRCAGMDLATGPRTGADIRKSRSRRRTRPLWRRCPKGRADLYEIAKQRDPGDHPRWDVTSSPRRVRSYRWMRERVSADCRHRPVRAHRGAVQRFARRRHAGRPGGARAAAHAGDVPARDAGPRVRPGRAMQPVLLRRPRRLPRSRSWFLTYESPSLTGLLKTRDWCFGHSRECVV